MSVDQEADRDLPRIVEAKISLGIGHLRRPPPGRMDPVRRVSHRRRTVDPIESRCGLASLTSRGSTETEGRSQLPWHPNSRIFIRSIRLSLRSLKASGSLSVSIVWISR